MDDVRSWDFIPENFWNNHIAHIILSELIFFYVQNRQAIKEKRWDFHSNFVSYLREKYKYFSEFLQLFSETELFTQENRMKVTRILKIVEKSIK